jgi:hypothetical protein
MSPVCTPGGKELPVKIATRTLCVEGAAVTFRRAGGSESERCVPAPTWRFEPAACVAGMRQMTQDRENDTGAPDVERRTQRRALIKKGIVLGGVAWSTPMIVSTRALAADGSPEPTTTSEATTTTTTTMPEPCECTFCATVTAGPVTLYFVCQPTDPNDCDCLCKCGGIDRPCAKTDPCEFPVTCTPVPNPC